MAQDNIKWALNKGLRIRSKKKKIILLSLGFISKYCPSLSAPKQSQSLQREREREEQERSNGFVFFTFKYGIWVTPNFSWRLEGPVKESTCTSLCPGVPWGLLFLYESFSFSLFMCFYYWWWFLGLLRSLFLALRSLVV